MSFEIPPQHTPAQIDVWQRWRAWLDRALVWTLIATAFVTPISTAAMNAGFALMLLLFILAGRYRERAEIVVSSPIAMAAIGMFAFFCIGAAWTTGPIDEARWQIAKYSKILFVPLIMCVAQSPRVRAAVLASILCSLLLTMLLSYVNAIHPLPAWLSRATREGVLSGNSYVFKHHIIQNVFLSFATLLCAVLALIQERARRRWILICLSVACAASIMFVAQGRTGYLTLLAVLLILVGLVVRRHPQWLKYVIVGSVLSGLALAASPTFKNRVAEAIANYEDYEQKGVANSIGNRMLFWKTSVQIIKAYPLLGAGTGSHKQEFLKRANSAPFAIDGAYNPHNQYLFIGTQLGITGIVFFVLILVVFWVSARYLPWQRQALARGTVLILAIYCMFDSPIFITEGYFWMILLGTLWAGIRWSTRQQLPEERLA